jgi:hypothetical protein
MKLNFWQKIGAVALVIALIVLVWRNSGGSKPAPTPTAPAVPPATTRAM